MTTAFVPKETRPGETRVAVSPESAKRFAQAKLELWVEAGAGLAAGFADEVFRAAGARIVGPEGWASAMVLKVQPPTAAEVSRMQPGAILVAFLQPHKELEVVGALRARGVTALAMELVPRISRAQAMDALSSQATVAGYKAVLLGAVHLKKMCPLLMTAAGTVQPAKVVVFGAGVAGLMAIATARRMGCKVEATDVRMAAKEQVESLGAVFITVPGAADMEGAGGYAKEQTPEFLRRQREEVGKRVAEADLVITTAQIPGKQAPRLVDAAMLRAMKRGAVLVDLAVESGGNCELSEAGSVVEREGVTIVGLANLPASVPQHASELYAKNVLALVKLLLDKEGQLAPDWNDEILAGCRLTHAGEIHHAPTAQALSAGKLA
ncbi:MAG: Re/Si-specific NAD(P)(+) transhydrogenase subunit alpha [Planctomycetes bacterium]|nr:Re/Si-specific NAD(P)(+) transhydrogenase subunit alpha [Planctomycetota bacterium]